ncbi:MAG: UDP-N-acetylmuramoyl-tripeptide--D-alanyl-D-alanine ligase [Lachnospiraceae bacterium]|nr:UDP-N-acetylmuramoyl-tripeptide--D-alanyl-D-alanine ligase [Lachnospiraceae bacterium]
MEQVTIADIVKTTNGTLLCGNPEKGISGFSIDSRQGDKDSLFVPIIGERVDAHRFIESALKINGATLTSEHDAMEDEKPWIKVEDTIKAMQQIGTAYRNRLNLPVVAVTGSVGKTTTREMIAWALSCDKKVFQTIGNQNSQIGVPLTLSRMTKEDEAAVLEIGMSERGQIETLTKMIRPNIAVVTVIGVSHIMQLKSQENICLEKMDIVKGLPEDGKVFLNGDDPFLAEYAGRLPFDTYFYGLGENCNYRADHVRQEEEGMAFDFVANGEMICPVRLGVLGDHNVKNALAALGICHQMGVSVKKAAKALESFQGQRQRIVDLGDVTLIEDAYNASPDSMKAAIKVLSGMDGKKTAVLADMLELGEKEKEYHRQVGNFLFEMGIDSLLCTGELAKEYIAGAKEAEAKVNKDGILYTRHFENNKELADYLKGNLEPGMKILIKGSNGMNLKEVMEELHKIENEESECNEK